MKTFKVITIGSNDIKTVSSEATTWGALKTDLNNAGVDTNNVSATLRVSKLALTRDDASIPEGETVVVLAPTKIKAGAELRPSSYDYSTGGIQRMIADMNNNMEAKLNALKAELQADFNRQVEELKNITSVSSEDRELLASVNNEFAAR